MSAGSDLTPALPHFRLQTLGTLALSGPAGSVPVSDQRQQQRRLALLAVLAASGERGRSRDQLLLLFWPDATQQRARHSLEQLLYSIRRSLHESVFAGINPLRLNPGIISSDVAEFEHTLRERNREAAVELYHGPFLDGFYLGDSPEFEQWLDSERSRLAREHGYALEQLAEAAETNGDYATAVRWRQKLSDADPLSSRNAIGMMRALANAGDHAAALRYAERYELMAARELGTTQWPEIAALVSELQSRTRTESPQHVASAAEPEQLIGDRIDPPDAVPDRGIEESPGWASRLRRPILWRVVAVILAAIVFGALRFGPELRSRPALAAAGEPSIAVLPMDNLSADAHDAALADGMTEELIAMLAKSGHLRVIGSTSAFAFKGKQMDTRRIADSLRVSNILEGSMQKIGTRLRVQVRLIDARDGSTRWSEIYDRKLKDVFSVQDEIARSVTSELDLRLVRGQQIGSSGLRHRTRNIAAYELYLRGRDPALSRSDSTLRIGVEYFIQAIAADSNYAAAYAGLAHMYSVLAIGDQQTPRGELISKARAAAEKAISLDDSLGEAHVELGLANLVAFTDVALAEQELKRGQLLDPAYLPVGGVLAVLYDFTGRPVEALAEARHTLAADPLSATANGELARQLYMNGRYDEALAQLNTVVALRPPLRRAISVRALCYLEKHMWPEAITTLRPAAEHGWTGESGLLGYALARAGQPDEARRILRNLLAGWRQKGNGASAIMMVYVGLGDRDQAFVWLQRAADARSLPPEIMGPSFADLRNDPRFVRIMKRLGLQKR